MIQITLPKGFPQQPLPFYLTLEEWAAACLDLHNEYLLLWSVTPTVIYGRHQDPQVEIDLDYCRANGIATYRRRSGGGAVYADLDNVMISAVTASGAGDVTTVFARHARRISDMLQALGVDAQPTGRNDIAIDGRKVAGNAFEHLTHRDIIHGTMLLDCNPEAMSAALTPSRAKLESKGVKSVPSRVTTLRQYLPDLTAEQFMAHAAHFLCGDTEPLVLDESQIEEVRRLSQPYYHPEWLNSARWHRHARHARRRIDGVGELTIAYTESEASPAGVEIIGLEGDFFALVDNPVEALNAALSDPHADVSAIVSGLTRADLLDALK